MKTEYIRLCRESELSAGRGSRFMIDDENEAAVFRIGEEIFAVDNVCPHNHVPEIYNGYVEGHNVSCPVHGFTFSLETGMQPTGFGCRLRTYRVIREGGWIFIEKPEVSRYDFGADAYE